MSNANVIDIIKERSQDKDLHHGYRSMTNYLQNQGFIINRKKVYRLMKGQQLLHEHTRPPGDKSRVDRRRFVTDGPLQGLEMDIKFVFVEQHRRQALVLSVIDVFTREIIGWHVAYSIKGPQVKRLWEQLIEEHLQAADTLRRGVHVQIRNDNDPRFSSQLVQDFFEANYLGQVFTHPYTPPRQNGVEGPPFGVGHIESFHAILSRSVTNRSFATLDHLEGYIQEFYRKYNDCRVHGSTAGLAPSVFKQQWDAGNISASIGEKGQQKFKLKVPRYTLAPRVGVSGNRNPKPVVAKKSDDGPADHQGPSVQKSLSASCC